MISTVLTGVASTVLTSVTVAVLLYWLLWPAAPPYAGVYRQPGQPHSSSSSSSSSFSGIGGSSLCKMTLTALSVMLISHLDMNAWLTCNLMTRTQINKSPTQTEQNKTKTHTKKWKKKKKREKANSKQTSKNQPTDCPSKQASKQTSQLAKIQVGSAFSSSVVLYKYWDDAQTVGRDVRSTSQSILCRKKSVNDLHITCLITQRANFGHAVIEFGHEQLMNSYGIVFIKACMNRVTQTAYWFVLSSKRAGYNQPPPIPPLPPPP